MHFNSNLLSNTLVKKYKYGRDPPYLNISCTYDIKPTLVTRFCKEKSRLLEFVYLIDSRDVIIFFIGDVEVLLDLPRYAHTATCTQKTEFLVLEMKHIDRL